MKHKKWAIKSLFILVIFLLLAGIVYSYLDWRNNYRDHIYPGITVGSLDMSGLSPSDAQDLLNKKTSKIVNDGFVFQYGNKKVSINSSVSSFDADLSYPALIFDVDGTINQALAYGQPKNFLNYVIFRLKSKNNKIVKPIYNLDEQKIKNSVSDSFKELNIPAVNSSFSVSETSGELQTNPEQLGKEINFDLAISEIKTNLDSLDNSVIMIKTKSQYPDVKSTDLSGLESQAKQIVGQGGLELIFNDTNEGTSTTETWTIKPERLLNWISVYKGPNGLSLSLDKDKIKQYLVLNVSPKINFEAVRPRFEINNGKIVNWQAGTNGIQVDIETSTDKINDEFLSGSKKINIITKEVADNNISSVDNLNIKEIIGTGHSNFIGSPVNRRKNIQVGAAAVNGLLLAPGEEFSLVKNLGDVSEKTGYFPELVIKGNKTLPEFGGGLCQIATTLFRSALASGLPITERHNHSYRVAYYEPAGTDAAVYIPQPDVKFINDTGNYILIQSRIVKNDIYFDFWGTKDGRIATTTTPTVYNIVKPEPAKYIETTELPAGQKKCTEKAHNGADAYFDYKVIYPVNSTSTPINKRFSSHYVPWQEVCLIGVGTATSTAATSSPKISTTVSSTKTIFTSTTSTKQ